MSDSKRMNKQQRKIVSQQRKQRQNARGKQYQPV